jgi:hypothetical protein
MTSTDKPKDPAAAANPGAPSEEAKARFREALERKSAAARNRGSGQQNTGAVHGSETTGPTQKMFRRKSG